MEAQGEADAVNWLRAAASSVAERISFVRNRSVSLIANWLAGALWLIDSAFLGIARSAYGGNAVAYACVRLLSQAISEAPLRAYSEDAKGARTELDRQHPLARLIARPNELQTEYEFWELTTIHMACAGHAFWWKERSNGGQIIALWPLRPDRVGPIYSDSDRPGERLLAGWSYQDPGSGEHLALPRRDVMAFNFPDPADESGGIVEGKGPLQVLAGEISADNEATSFVGALLHNYAAPSVILKLKTAVKTEAEAKFIKAMAKAEFSGAKRGELGLVDAETGIEVLGFNMQQLEFPDLRDVSESRIAAVIGVPAVLVGLRVGLKSASIRANFSEARQYFAETTVANYWRRYQDQFTADVAAEFGPGVVCAFDTSNVRALAGQRIERLKPIQDAYKGGAATVNEYRAELGLPRLAGGDVRLVATSVMEVPAQLEEENAAAVGMRYLAPGHLAPMRLAADPRDLAETRLRDGLVTMFATIAPIVAEKISAGQLVTEDEIAEAFRAVLQPELARIATGQALTLGTEVQVQFDPAVVNGVAADWARNYTYSLVKNLTATTRKVIADATSQFVQTPGMAMRDLEALLDPAFGPVRAEMIAVTETTRAYSAATTHYQEMLAGEGVEMDQMWRVSRDERVCPICGPLDGRPESEWSERFPGGPPAHVRCRCHLTLRLASAVTE